MTTASSKCITPVADTLARLPEARLHDPHSVLGLHALDQETACYRAWLPHASEVWITLSEGPNLPLVASTRIPGLFTWASEI